MQTRPVQFGAIQAKFNDAFKARYGEELCKGIEAELEKSVDIWESDGDTKINFGWYPDSIRPQITFTFPMQQFDVEKIIYGPLFNTRNPKSWFNKIMRNADNILALKK